jgi:hypothetical protein
MAINTTALVNAVASHAVGLGFYRTVATAEPRGTPATGFSAAVWLQRLTPLPRRSGLNVTSALVVLTLRQYGPAQAEPRDTIDARMTDAMDALIAAYTGDFDLGGVAAEIDLLGNYGQALEAVAGYIESGGQLCRVLDLTIPIVVNNAWEQAT